MLCKDCYDLSDLMISFTYIIDIRNVLFKLSPYYVSWVRPLAGWLCRARVSSRFSIFSRSCAVSCGSRRILWPDTTLHKRRIRISLQPGSSHLAISFRNTCCCYVICSLFKIQTFATVFLLFRLCSINNKNSWNKQILDEFWIRILVFRTGLVSTPRKPWFGANPSEKNMFQILAFRNTGSGYEI